MEEHAITYDSVEYQISGYWDREDKSTGYKGGFSWMKICINDMDVSQHLNENTIDRLTELVVELNY